MAFDSKNPAHLIALKAEVEIDPLSRGYAPIIDDTSELLRLLNVDDPTYIVSKPKISAALVRSGTTLEAYDGVLADKQEWLKWMTGSNGFQEELLVVTSDLRQNLAGDPITNGSIWATGERTDMNAVMLALMDVPGTRMEIIFGYGTVIGRGDWFAARDS